VASRPRWFGVLALSVFIVVCGTAAFMSTEVGKQALLDQQVRSAESFGRPLNDQAYERLEQFLPYAAYASAASQLVFIPVIAVIIAAIALAIFNAVLGGDATFRQVFAIVAHSGVIIAIQNLFSMPLDYARETLSSPTNLAVFLPFLEENSFLAHLLGSIDLFVLWWTVSLAIGLGTLYKRRSGPIATTMIVVYLVIAAAIAAVRAALSGA